MPSFWHILRYTTLGPPPARGWPFGEVYGLEKEIVIVNSDPARASQSNVAPGLNRRCARGKNSFLLS